MKRLRIAFDLDGVIVDKPPLIPKSLIEKWFRGTKEKTLNYRIPSSRFEIAVRKLSHFYLFRPPIKENLKAVADLSRSQRYRLYIISGRYSFLKNETRAWLERRGINSYFHKIYLNSKNEQPYLFKEKILKKIKAEWYVDDDNLIADYLAKNLKTKIYCFGKQKHACLEAKGINYLSDIRT
ncbi:MAG: hypothetical protein WC686_00585 [Candidatus Shapirobacteria bacterium]|jgi:phosphoglycolate phosphatase-like HAD superfamily hydrolase